MAEFRHPDNDELYSFILAPLEDPSAYPGERWCAISLSETGIPRFFATDTISPEIVRNPLFSDDIVNGIAVEARGNLICLQRCRNSSEDFHLFVDDFKAALSYHQDCDVPVYLVPSSYADFVMPCQHTHSTIFVHPERNASEQEHKKIDELCRRLQKHGHQPRKAGDIQQLGNARFRKISDKFVRGSVASKIRPLRGTV